MSTTILTSAWDAIILNFSPIFTQPTAHIFINLIIGWILCTKRRTVTGILPFADPKNKRPHDAYHRLFPKSRWLPAHLWKLLAQMLIELFYPAGTVWMDMDDTIFHRTGTNYRVSYRCLGSSSIINYEKCESSHVTEE